LVNGSKPLVSARIRGRVRRSVAGAILTISPSTSCHYPAILGFSNRWYEAALRDAIPYSLGQGLVIRIPGSPLYVACKWAAFEGRAHGDVIGSHDLEDIITVVAGRPELLEELRLVEPAVGEYVASETARFLAHPHAHDVIVGALPDAWDDPTLLADIEARLRTIATVEGRL
jgi:hypothetical protein